MARDHVSVIRAYYAAWSDRDLDALLETLHPEIEIRTSGAFPDIEPSYRTYQGVRSFWEAMLLPWETFRLDVERIVEGDGCAAAAIRFHARGKGSGALTELRQGHAVRFKGDRVAEVSFHASLDGALEAAGLSE
jgi:ketosteroid isomerase-like protein